LKKTVKTMKGLNRTWALQAGALHGHQWDPRRIVSYKFNFYYNKSDPEAGELRKGNEH
jgi:hypothetical protein